MRYHPAQGGGGDRASWAEYRSRSRWVPLGDGPLKPGEWRFEGVIDRVEPHGPVPCEEEPVRVIEVPPDVAGSVAIGDAPIRIGLFRVVACPDGVGWVLPSEPR